MEREVAEQWETNLYRVVAAHGGPESTGDAVWKVWSNGRIKWHRKPSENDICTHGSRVSGKLYPTESQAWQVLLDEFDTWAAKKRAAITKRLREASK